SPPMKVHISPAWISPSMGAWRRSNPGAVPRLALQPCQSWDHASQTLVLTQDRRNIMSNNHVQIVKDFFAAMGRGDKQGLLALSAEDIEWIIPGEDWPLAGTHRGHAGLADLL